MLNRKSEELSVYEREVGQRDRRIAELEAQDCAGFDARAPATFDRAPTAGGIRMNGDELQARRAPMN
jgi:hypothetical protein